MAQLKSTKVFGDLNVTGEVNVSTKVTVNGEEVWDTGNLLNIGTTAATARTALGLGAGATRWPTFAEVTGKPATYAPSGHTHPISQVTGLDAALADKADKTTQVIAGTGLTGGGTLAANRTLVVSYGTTAGTAAQGNDSRLSNSREWTGATISQAEAEAGTATTRRAFTAQRVRQAIVAWWNSVTGVFGRDLVSSADNTVARSKLGLGTAATKDVGTIRTINPATVVAPDSYGTLVVNLDTATGSFDMPDDTPVGGRVLVRKINATQGSININAPVGETITRAGLSNVALNEDGNYWILEKVEINRWELVDGHESGNNQLGSYMRTAEGNMYFRRDGIRTGGITSLFGTIYTGETLGAYTYPTNFEGIPAIKVALSTDVLWAGALSNPTVYYLKIYSGSSNSNSYDCYVTGEGRWYI